ncbi:MAG: FixH family protein [Albidovulum sp.]|nr:FixH family protein [Albidovulum sp.]MDE0531593.1 FixH family protein [Albidovulum sp.]
MTKSWIRPITGFKVLLLTSAAFGIVIAANLALTVSAIATFPGLEVRNGYIASQQFERKRIAQENLNWHTAANYSGGSLAIGIFGKGGHPAPIREFSATIARPTHMREDISPEFLFDGEHFVARIDLMPGYWIVDLRATSGEGIDFRQRKSLLVAE